MTGEDRDFTAEARRRLEQRITEICRRKEWRTATGKPFEARVLGSWIRVLPLEGKGKEIDISIGDLLDCFHRAAEIEGKGTRPQVSEFTSEFFASYAASFYWGLTLVRSMA